MKPFYLLLLLAFLVAPQKSISQDLSAYKYVIVPVKYDFLNEKDEHKLNSLTAFLFEKNGFTAIMQNEDFPLDLRNNRCSALMADVLSDTGMFSFVTKVKVILTNCNDQIVFESKEGRSKLKKYKFAYQEALRDAFSSVEKLDYSYSPSQNENESVKTVEKNVVPKTLSGTYFVQNGKNYALQKEDGDLVLKNSKTEKPIGFLYKTSNENYLYRSEKIQGTAYFDNEGNLVVEYFDPETKKMQKMIFAKKN